MKRHLLQLAQRADRVMLIAPETGGCLERVAGWFSPCSEKLISPGADWIQMTASKSVAASVLAKRGFNALPVALSWPKFIDLDAQQRAQWFPVVLKPDDGAGSDGIQWLESEAQFQLVTDERDEVLRVPWRIESYVPGEAASISAIGLGERGFRLLPPTIQLFDRQPIGHYIGARFPLPAELVSRCQRLACRCLEALPPFRGYIGLDLVLGASAADDRLIEINPRLTMSFLELRQQANVSLARLLLDPPN